VLKQATSCKGVALPDAAFRHHHSNQPGDYAAITQRQFAPLDGKTWVAVRRHPRCGFRRQGLIPRRCDDDTATSFGGFKGEQDANAQDDLDRPPDISPVCKSGAGDTRFTERYWYTAHPIDAANCCSMPGSAIIEQERDGGFAGLTIGRGSIISALAPARGPLPLKRRSGRCALEIVEE